MSNELDALWADFATANNTTNGYLLATTITPEPPQSDPARLSNWQKWTNSYSIQTDLRYRLQYNPALKLEKKEASTWLEVFTAYYAFTGKLLAAEEAQNVGKSRDADWSAVYEGWKEVLSAMYRGYSNNIFAAWTIPCLYVMGKYLRVFAIKADDNAASQRDSGPAFGGIQEEDAFSAAGKNERLEDAARQINRIFALCLSDRSDLHTSRKWALYYIANLLFKTYFKLSSIPLSKNILRSLKASGSDMPPLSAFPRAHQVTFKYYSGVISFLEEDYATAEEFLVSAYEMCCHRGATRNLALILTYLIPTKLLTSHRLPTTTLLQHSPALEKLFAPVCTAIKKADLRAFNAALERGEDEFVKRRIYLTLERGRDIILRNLFRKTFLAGGYGPAKEGDAGPPTRRTRVPVMEFAAALRMAGAEVGDGEGGVDRDEVECLIANSIYKNFMKGYIARDRGIVVLSKAGAFPGTGV